MRPPECRRGHLPEEMNEDRYGEMWRCPRCGMTEWMSEYEMAVIDARVAEENAKSNVEATCED